MRLFVAICFGYETVCAILGLVLLTFSEFPYTRKITRANATGYYVVSLGIASWAAYLLWIKK
jgi:hypothetical protein